MVTKTFSKWFWALAVLAILAASLVFSFTQTVQAAPLAATNCSCVVYIQNRYGLKKPWVNAAKDMDQVLARNAFTQLNTPQVGAVVVMQTNFPGTNSTYGHVGTIINLSDRGDKWQFTLRQGGSNPSGSTEYNCNNINSVVWAAYPKSWVNQRITYWLPPQGGGGDNNNIWKDGGSYTIKSVTSNLVMDVEGGKTDNETKIVQWGSHGGLNQIWKAEAKPNGYFRLHSALNYGKCMVVLYASKNNGGKIVLYDCRGGENEMWKPIPSGNNYYIQNQYSGKVLVVPSGSRVEGVQIIQWSWDGGPGQTWNFK